MNEYDRINEAYKKVMNENFKQKRKELMADEKKCPEGQEWCETSQKCVTPPGRGLKKGKQDGKQSQSGKVEKYLN